MKHIRLCVLGVLAVLLIVGPLSGVVAGGYYRPIELQFDSQIGIDMGLEDIENRNAGNYSGSEQFKDVINNAGYGDNGIYWGNMFPAYRVDLWRYDNMVSFNISINLTKQDVQFGVSNYWLRIPVDGNTVRRVIVANTSLSYNEFGNQTIGFWQNDTTILDIDKDMADKRVVWDYTGVYVQMLSPILPGNYGFTFFCFPEPYYSIAFYLSNERYTGGEHNITFFNLNTDWRPGGDTFSYQNVVTERLPNSLAVGFLFVRGYDKNGYSSIGLLDTDVIVINDLVNRSVDDYYPSLYLPFRSDGPVNFTIRWEIPPLVGPVTYTILFENPADFNQRARFKEASFDGQKDLLMVSCPWFLNDTSAAASGDDYTGFKILVSPDRPIEVLTTLLDGPIALGSWLSNAYETDDDLDEKGFYNRTQKGYNIFAVRDYTAGVWARTFVYDAASYIDFGFAEGVRFPGESEVYIFLDTGAEVFFSGSVEDIWNDILENEYLLEQAIRDGVKSAIRWASDGFLVAASRFTQQSVSYLKGMLDYLINMFKKVWRFLEGIFDYFLSIFQIIPIFLAIVGVEFAANFLTERKKDKDIVPIEQGG